MEAVAYYLDQSPITDPGEMAGHLAGLPHDLAALQRVARGLVLHYRADNPSAHGIPEDRLAEIDSRYAETMLHPSSRATTSTTSWPRFGMLTKPAGGWSIRSLATTMPTRPTARSWTRWMCPGDRFLVAGSPWQACRKGEADPTRFLVDPGLDIEDTRGWPYLRHNLVHDLAALNKVEMLLWDGWGLIERERPSERELQLLDHLAQATSSKDAPFDELRRLYQAEEGLQVPSAVTSYSPASLAPRTVTLDASPT